MNSGFVSCRISDELTKMTVIGLIRVGFLNNDFLRCSLPVQVCQRYICQNIGSNLNEFLYQCPNFVAQEFKIWSGSDSHLGKIAGFVRPELT